MTKNNLSHIQTLEDHPENDTTEAIRKTILNALEQSISKEDAEKNIRKALEKDVVLLGQVIEYAEDDNERHINAEVEILNKEGDPVSIDVSYIGDIEDDFGEIEITDDNIELPDDLEDVG